MHAVSTFFDMETNTQPKKRPVGMTILLVLSLISAVWNILSGFIMYIMTPAMTEMTQNGQIEEMMQPYSAMFGEDQLQIMKDGMNLLTQIDSKYWLFLSILFIVSLMGVIRMFKGNKAGFHIYSISQILVLINASLYLYPKQPQSGFTSDLMLTAIFILLYYLYFKRMDLVNGNQQNTNEL